MLKQNNEGEEKEIEISFVDGLLKMYKLREQISKARAEIIATNMILSYNHRFGYYLFGTYLTFILSFIKSVIGPSKVELNREKKVEAATYAHQFFIMQHAAFKCI